MDCEVFVKLPPTKLFFRCAVPSMITMVFGALYQIADGLFVGRFIGEDALAAQPGQYFARLDLGTNTPPQTAQRFKSLSRKISASSVPSSGKTAQRNHLQQTEKETVCGQVQVSPSSRTMQLPSSKQQHSRRIRLAACFLCAGVMR